MHVSGSSPTINRGLRTAAALAALALSLAPAFAAHADTASTEVAGVAVHSFTNEPFALTQCYPLDDPFYSPVARIYNQPICIHYQATNSESVGVQGADVAWSLSQEGTATITSQQDGSVLYSGPFKVTDAGHDLGGNAQCSTPDGHAWMGNCQYLLSSIDTEAYHWEIPFVYGLDLNVTAPGQYCIRSASPLVDADTGTVCHDTSVQASAHQDAATGVEVAGVQADPGRSSCLWIRDGAGPWVCRADAP